MISRGFIDSLLSREDDLFQKIYGFNVNIAQYIDKTYVESQLPDFFPVWDSMLEDRRAAEKLSEYLLSEFALVDQYYYNFEEPRKRLVLLDFDTLNSLIMIAGVAMYSELISKVITKKELHGIKEALGEKMYFFATKRASLLRSAMPSFPMDGGAVTAQKVFAAGKHCIELCFDGEDEAMLRRFALKFPNTIKWSFRSHVPEAQKTQAWNYLHKLLIKEIKPEIAVCFI